MGDCKVGGPRPAREAPEIEAEPKGPRADDAAEAAVGPETARDVDAPAEEAPLEQRTPFSADLERRLEGTESSRGEGAGNENPPTGRGPSPGSDNTPGTDAAGRRAERRRSESSMRQDLRNGTWDKDEAWIEGIRDKGREMGLSPDQIKDMVDAEMRKIRGLS